MAHVFKLNRQQTSERDRKMEVVFTSIATGSLSVLAWALRDRIVLRRSDHCLSPRTRFLYLGSRSLSSVHI